MSKLKFILNKINVFYKKSGIVGVLLKQLVIAIGILAVLAFLMLQWLNYSTNHGEFKTVPDLSKLSFDQAKAKLEEFDLTYKLQDTSNYNPKYPKFSVIEQSPIAGEKVKEGRKIYLKINPSGYREITIPYIIQKTRRTAESSLEAVGFKVEKVSYQDNIGKDMVLGLKYKGETVKPGDLIPKTSKIELILGNGKRPGSTPKPDEDGGT